MVVCRPGPKVRRISRWTAVPTRYRFLAWRKAGSPAISQTIESVHISQPAFGMSPAASSCKRYRTKNQARNPDLCVSARRASTGADGVQRWSELSKRWASSAWRVARFANRFLPQVVPQRSLEYPARTHRAPRHSSLRGTRRSFLYIESAGITRREEPRPGRGGETSLGAENINLVCSQFPFRQPRPVRGEKKNEDQVCGRGVDGVVFDGGSNDCVSAGSDASGEGSRAAILGDDKEGRPGSNERAV